MPIADAGYFFADRLMMLVAVEIRHKRLYIPMLCDTGAPKSYLSTTTLDRFDLNTSFVAHHLKIHVGRDSLFVNILDENAPDNVRGLNVLGSDLLRQLLPDIVPILVSSINNKNKND